MQQPLPWYPQLSQWFSFLHETEEFKLERRWKSFVKGEVIFSSPSREKRLGNYWEERRRK